MRGLRAPKKCRVFAPKSNKYGHLCDNIYYKSVLYIYYIAIRNLIKIVAIKLQIMCFLFLIQVYSHLNHRCFYVHNLN